MARTQQPPVNQVSKGAIACKGLLIDPERETWIFNTDGAPTNAQDGAGWAGIGSLCIDSTNGKLYINTGTLASPTWTVVGTQT